jgi:metallo-beta-lactamase family protein
VRVTLQFLGAAETVTGSKHLLTVNNRKFLIDCGLFQGLRELKERNWANLPFPVAEIETVIITHAHIDHIGYLPRLWAQGYRGPILCTGATSEITRLSLPDSGRLQEEYARHANKHGFAEHKPALPLYTEDDANAVCKLLDSQKLDSFIELGGACKFRFLRAGHILGSAFVEFHLPDGRTVLFTGDLGRPNQPIIRDPEIVEAADFMLLESTYGDRDHPDVSPGDFLRDAISQAHESGGMIVIPAFAIGRTQDILYYIHDLEKRGDCPALPIYVDSPMAVDATGIYARHHEDHDLEMEQLERDDDNPLRPKNVRFVQKVDESKALNAREGPGIIISSSGMASGGRVVHHLMRRLPDPACQVLFVGYQAAGTLGRELIEGGQRVRVMGQEVPVRAEIKSLQSLSAHADSSEILGWLKGFKSAPKRTFLVHGEPPAQSALQGKIRAEFGWEVEIPKLNDAVTLD